MSSPDSQMEGTLRVMVADDHPIVLAGIKALLDASPGIDFVGHAMRGDEVIPEVRTRDPDVLVMDLSMPGLNGVELLPMLRSEFPQLKIVALTVHEDRAYLHPILAGGANGYVLKRSAAEDLIRAVRAVAAGGLYIDPAVAGKALSDLSAGAAPVEKIPDLSPRETDVLRFTAQGFSNKEIAARLDVSVKTVETYKARASEKLGLQGRSDVVRYGAAQGWLDDLSATG